MYTGAEIAQVNAGVDSLLIRRSRYGQCGWAMTSAGAFATSRHYVVSNLKRRRIILKDMASCDVAATKREMLTQTYGLDALLCKANDALRRHTRTCEAEI